MKKVNWLITDNNITVNYEGQTHIVSRTDALADRLIKAVKEKRFEEIPDLVSAAKRIENFSQGNFTVRDGAILIKGVEAPTVLGNKIVKFSNEGLPFEPLIKFAENLQKNPSFRAVNELFQFLEKNDHPITESGCFIAYKKVRRDFKDIHTGTMDNSVGVIVSMPRNQVNEDATQTCSYGLHVANWDYAHNIYASGSDSIMLEVEVNPADVVAVPVDYDQAKMRTCKYKVIGVVDKEHSGASLRITNPSLSKDDDLLEEDTCDVCGEEEFDCECEFCEFCGEEEFDCECDDVELEEEDEDALDDEDDDEYPWEDELD